MAEDGSSVPIPVTPPRAREPTGDTPLAKRVQVWRFEFLEPRGCPTDANSTDDSVSDDSGDDSASDSDNLDYISWMDPIARRQERTLGRLHHG